jgi:hypothetical protein
VRAQIRRRDLDSELEAGRRRRQRTVAVENLHGGEQGRGGRRIIAYSGGDT